AAVLAGQGSPSGCGYRKTRSAGGNLNGNYTSRGFEAAKKEVISNQLSVVSKNVKMLLAGN
ncbi:MAG: hypothetical protein DMG27_19035, partial [Acidobacteria bacterium]